MNLTKIITLTILLAFTTSSIAMAATTVRKNTTTTVSAAVKNITNKTVSKAVKMKAYDQAGTQVANLCKVVSLKSGKTTNVSFSWKAPNYLTGLYWTHKIESSCP
ncbi:MAG: CARDB domain-containing protein [Pseudomonadota bacterium]